MRFLLLQINCLVDWFVGLFGGSVDAWFLVGSLLIKSFANLCNEIRKFRC
jgi:hypothetical protein